VVQRRRESTVRGRLGALALGAGLGLVGVVPLAGAAEVSLEPPLSCPNGGEIAFLAERALGRPLSSVPGPDFVITMAAQGTGFSARVETREPGAAAAVRSFSAASCDELVETLALGVAIALGGSAEEAPPAAPRVADPALETAAETALPAPASGPAAEPHGTASVAQGPDPSGPQDAPVSTSDGPSPAALAFVIGDSGSLPNAALGVAVGAGLRWKVLELRGTGLLLPARHGSVDTLGGGAAGADIGLVAGSASACAPLGLQAKAVELDVCAGWELGRLRATGTGVLRPYRKSRLWSAARLDVGARWAVPDSPLWLELLGMVLAPLRRDEFILRDIGSVHHAPNVVARAGVGVGWVIW
jgi:hypothetical protein